MFFLLDIYFVKKLFSVMETNEIKMMATYCVLHYLPFMLDAMYAARFVTKNYKTVIRSL